MKEKKIQKLLSLILSVFMVFSVMTVPAFAAPTDNAAPEPSAAAEAADTDADKASEETDKADKETATEDNSDKDQKSDTISVEENFGTYKVNANDIDVSDVGTGVVLSDVESDKIDTDDSEIATIEEELKETTVLNDEGEAVKLTQEQIQTILYLYSQYLDQWKEHADVLGVQLPFFLQYNDNGEDGLGILGEMLVLAGYTVEDVRAGKYKYDDLLGMIQNFLYADKFGLEFYGDKVKASRDEVMKAVKESGAKTEAQKILVINDWLAHNCEFDMSYIMNMGKENPVIVAENPQKHEKYEAVHDEMYKLYEQQITQQFHDQFYEGIKAQFRQQFYEAAIKQAYCQGCIQQGLNEDDAKEAAEQFMIENEEAIAEDAPGFVEKTFGPEAAAQISEQADAFIKDAEENGVEVDPVNAPGYKMTIEQITQQQMKEQPLDELNGKTANQAIPVFAEQAAQGLTNGIINAWLGNHFGVLAEGTAVCAGYSKAFSYLMQYMHPEVYGVAGADTDMDVAENWKTAKDISCDKDGNIDIDAGYIVDMVRITFDASVTMYGETADNFGADHFWNAVKVDGQWYYVDPCYTDIYVECMSRDRVEIDGTMNHLYFMFSHDTALEMYDGNMQEDGIKTLYAEAANDKKYESSWYSRVASNAYSDGDNFYYLYDSTDMLEIMREFNKENQNDIDYNKMQKLRDPEYKLVRHAITDSDIVSGKDGDSDYEALIEFNYKENEDDDTTIARVYNPDTKTMEENELLTKLFAQFKEECDIYPSIKLTSALYDGKLYFNLSNCILSYDLSSGAVKLVKEYNTVYAKRDKTVAFGGMGFDVVSSKDNADFTVEDHPIAAMTIKEDGKMYVSIATNFAYISGKDPHNFEDSSSYGYEFEETNYNPDYSNYASDSDYSDEQLEAMGYSREINDNDEFMWSAVFVDTIEMSKVSGNELDENALQEECDHHFIHFNEEYYTKDDDGNWNKGDCYVCTICKYAVSEPTEPKKNSNMSDEDFEKLQAEYKKEKAIYDAAVASAGHTYVPTDAEWSDDYTSVSFSDLECTSVCEDKKDVLDFLREDKTISVKLKTPYTAKAKINAPEGADCEKGFEATSTAEGKTDEGYKYSISKDIKVTEGSHSYDGTFTWPAKAPENTDEMPAVTVSDVKCSLCESEPAAEDVSVVVTKGTETSATCEKNGTISYTAKASVKDSEGKTLGTLTDKKAYKTEDALGHNYEATFTWADDYSSATAVLTCQNDENHTTKALKCKVSSAVTKEATCTEAGTSEYTATCTYDGETYSDKETASIDAKGHSYGEPEFTFAENHESATALFTCDVCKETEEVKCEGDSITSKTTAATCTKDGKTVYTAKCKLNGKTYTGTDTVTIKAKGHNYGDPVFQWTEDNNAVAVFICQNNKTHAVQENCTVTSKITKEPTCTEEGVKTYTAAVNFEGKDYEGKKDAVVNALGHSYGDPKFTWNSDHKSAKADFACSRGDDTQTIECSVTSVTTDPTCTEEGRIDYSAKCEFKGKTYTGTDSEAIPAKGHRYVEGADAEFIWSKDYTSAQVGCPCADCDYIKPVSIPADDITHEVTAEPTYTSEGEEIYTASYTDENGVTYTDSKTLVIPKLDAEASLTKTSVSVYAGDKVTVSLKSKYSADVITGCKTADTTYSSASLSSSKKSVTITGKKAGKTTVTITTASNETVKLTVTVTTPPSEATVAKDIAKAEGNISGAVFARLSARTSSVKNTSITLKWNSVSTADGYIVYGNKCGTKYKFKKLATVKGSSKVTYTHKSLSKGTYYKYIVLAYKNVNGKKVILSKAKTLHVVTGGSKTYANASSVKPAKTSVSVTKGKTYTLKATTVLPKGKKAKVHRSLAFESSNTQIATVTSKGVITGKKAGTCYVYVYAQNGKYYKVKVTVK